MIPAHDPRSSATRDDLCGHPLPTLRSGEVRPSPRSAWVHRVRLWVHKYFGEGPPPLAVVHRLVAGDGKTCPKCGCASVKTMTDEEAWAFHGFTRLVVVRPRMCRNCGTGFDPPPSLGSRVLMASVAGLGFAIGVAVIVLAIWMCSLAVVGDLEPVERVVFALSFPCLSLIGLLWCARCYDVGVWYLGADGVRVRDS